MIDANKLLTYLHTYTNNIIALVLKSHLYVNQKVN